MQIPKNELLLQNSWEKENAQMLFHFFAIVLKKKRLGFS